MKKLGCVYVCTLDAHEKKSMIVALRIAASVCPLLELCYSYYYLHIPRYACIYIFFFHASISSSSLPLHSFRKYFLALSSGKVARNMGFTRNVLYHLM